MYNRRFTPHFITRLEDNEIFVFGSNLSGFHLSHSFYKNVRVSLGYRIYIGFRVAFYRHNNLIRQTDNRLSLL